MTANFEPLVNNNHHIHLDLNQVDLALTISDAFSRDVGLWLARKEGMKKKYHLKRGLYHMQ